MFFEVKRLSVAKRRGALRYFRSRKEKKKKTENNTKKKDKINKEWWIKGKFEHWKYWMYSDNTVKNYRIEKKRIIGRMYWKNYGSVLKDLWMYLRWHKQHRRFLRYLLYCPCYTHVGVLFGVGILNNHKH